MEVAAPFFVKPKNYYLNKFIYDPSKLYIATRVLEAEDDGTFFFKLLDDDAYYEASLFEVYTQNPN